MQVKTTLRVMWLSLGLGAAAFSPVILVACTPANTATATADVTAAQTAIQTAITGYGVVKGIAQVAAMADPALAAPIAVAIAALDPLVAKAQAALNAASTDAPTLIALAAQITAQAQALQVMAAPAIKVVPSATTTK